jgi:hypothetical protein
VFAQRKSDKFLPVSKGAFKKFASAVRKAIAPRSAPC